MRLQLERQEAAIVLRGNFNPAIFQPAWFAAYDLIRRQEADAADAADIKIVHPEAAVFRAEWLEINSTRDRFQASTSQEAFYEPLRDLVLGVLALLSHTPVRVMGLNRHFHYRLPSEQYWHNVGHRLAPKGDWETILTQPGMRSLVIEGQRPDSLVGYIRVTVEPSAKVEPGLYVNVNDHYELEGSSPSAVSTKKASDILSDHWTASIVRSLRIAEHVAGLGGSP